MSTELQDEFDRIITVHRDDVLAYAILLCRNRPDAEDITQTVMLSAWKSFETFDRRFPKAWLYKIAYNAFVNRYRYRQRRPERLTDFTDREDVGLIAKEGVFAV